MVGSSTLSFRIDGERVYRTGCLNAAMRTAVGSKSPKPARPRSRVSIHFQRDSKFRVYRDRTRRRRFRVVILTVWKRRQVVRRVNETFGGACFFRTF